MTCHFILMFAEDCFQFNNVSKGFPSPFAGGIHQASLARSVFTPAADRIKVFQSKSERIDLPMAGGACSVITVCSELFADGSCPPNVGFNC